MFSVAPLAALLLSTSAVRAQSSVAELVGQLRLAPTEVDRLRLLSDEQLIFDYNAAQPGDVGVVTGAGGHTVEGNAANFPAVIGQGVAMTIGYLGPCGINTPHTHPRATEINFSVNSTLQAGFLEENGAAFRTVNIPAGSAAVFPQGAIHFEFNPSCEDAMFVAGFNHENPGVQSIAQRYLGLPPDILSASLGGVGIEYIQGLEEVIPDNIAYGLEECFQRCGITKEEQPTAQRQPRVAGNAFPGEEPAESEGEGSEEPAAEEPAAEEPAAEEPAAEEPAAEEPAAEEPAAEEPATEEPATEEGSTEEPAAEEPAAEEPAAEEPATEEPATEEGSTEEPAAEEPAAEEPATEEPAAEEPAAEEPAAEEPAAEEPATEEPATEEGSTEEPATEEGSTEEGSYEEGSTEEGSTEEPSTEEPSTEEPTPAEPSTSEESTSAPCDKTGKTVTIEKGGEKTPSSSESD